MRTAGIAAVLLALGAELLAARTGVAQANSAQAAPLKSPTGIHGRAGILLPAPPETAKIPVVDNYFGTRIADDYRWLEDGKSAETRQFVQTQMAYTERYLEQAHVRPELAGKLDDLVHMTTWSAPILRFHVPCVQTPSGRKCGDSGLETYFFTKRLASEDQASIYVRYGWSSPTAAKAAGKPANAKADNSQVGRDIRLVDPAAFSRDPNTSVSLLAVSKNGSLLVYGIRQGGSDDEEIHFLNVETGKTLEDTLPAARYNSVDLAPDLSGVYFARWTHEGSLVYFHKFGTLAHADTLVFGREFHGELLGEMDLISARVTPDNHYLVVSINRGVPAKRVDIVFRDLTRPGSFFEVLVWSFEARFSPLYAGGEWYLRTDLKAPNGRIVKATPGVAPEAWQTIVPEGPEPIDAASIVGQKLFVHRLKDVQGETAIYTLDGKPAGAIAYPGMGDGSVVSGQPGDRYGFYSFQSYIQPPTIYRYDTATGAEEVFAQPRTDFDPGEYELKQVFYPSKDGTRIPMFVAGRKGLKMDGSERLLMTGYGGFNLSETPDWSPLYAAWMEQGGWFAVPNLRGGGEYGEAWHEQGMFEKKQNVFDDFFAAAEYLIASRYTAAGRLAITGRSNGGLLMGAAMTERPDLFAAIWCGYPLLDMLRYQKFELGRLWTSEYGSAENEKDFPYLRKYSPYQNVKPGAAYPAILFFTGDSDTRVDPLHARKMTAAMQAASASGRPILLHYSLKSGHSAGVSAAQLIDDYADQLAFLWTETGPS